MAASGSAKQPSLFSFVLIYVVPAVSLILGGASLRKAVAQVNEEAAQANRNVLDPSFSAQTSP